MPTKEEVAIGLLTVLVTIAIVALVLRAIDKSNKSFDADKEYPY
jgi:preprotein translocase subunit SecE